MRHSIVLITGGARSGKSRYAEERARECGARFLYVATAEPRDDEMARRIAEHRARRGVEWTTVEEPVALQRALAGRSGAFDAAVIDCVTLWLSNLMSRADEIYIQRAVEEFIAAAQLVDAPLFIVTNEVGSGIVPDNALARRFRDLAGWTNQRLAAAADEVVLVVAGLPVFIKRGSACV
ncbi:MAG TPA: bifunctional adenosylcobinamide kinase/adenosylcobinamide-phosphate guanylyltransferase [Verrucomicrobiae bacterium]|jgi:adenosylcobinamide kinase / adenosylcobinamide-phosphate guanylyltransferase|nr:bifunctional adenosylcobinamide kinase/adenosylcobinamide-phosphate guanylyltransferase [Verrucomicrobiae bacterium]